MALPTDPAVPADRDEAGVPLSSLAAGCSATVLAVDASTPQSRRLLDASTPQSRRLLDLGFVPETEVRVVRRAPLGDPIAFYLRGGQICLRRAEAEQIRVYAVRLADEE